MRLKSWLSVKCACVYVCVSDVGTCIIVRVRVCVLVWPRLVCEQGHKKGCKAHIGGRKQYWYAGEIDFWLSNEYKLFFGEAKADD